MIRTRRWPCECGAGRPFRDLDRRAYAAGIATKIRKTRISRKSTADSADSKREKAASRTARRPSGEAANRSSRFENDKFKAAEQGKAWPHCDA